MFSLFKVSCFFLCLWHSAFCHRYRCVRFFLFFLSLIHSSWYLVDPFHLKTQCPSLTLKKCIILCMWVLPYHPSHWSFYCMNLVTSDSTVSSPHLFNSPTKFSFSALHAVLGESMDFRLTGFICSIFQSCFKGTGYFLYMSAYSHFIDVIAS